MVVELLRSAKPRARFESEICDVRFIVPFDLRYTFCICGASAPCPGVALAVHAFRTLAADQAGGLVTTQRFRPVAVEVLQPARELLSLSFSEGLEKLPRLWQDRLARAGEQLQQQGLLWPAALLNDLMQQHQRYQRSDALFDPDDCCQLIGEFLLRADVLCSEQSHIPQLFVAGSRHRSRDSAEYRNARLIGLGSLVHETRQAFILTACLVDADSGALSVCQRQFVQPQDSAEQRSFQRLAQTDLRRGVSLHGLAGGQLLVKKISRSLSHEINLGRAALSLQPQSYQWEKLPSALLQEDFAELRQWRALQHPASLRPRRHTDDLIVLPVAELRHYAFNPARQCLELSIADQQGETLRIRHPFHSLAVAGFDALLATLQDQNNARLCFVSGRLQSQGGELLLQPACLVFEDTARRRFAVLPWTAANEGEKVDDEELAGRGLESSQEIPALRELRVLLSDTLLRGVNWLDSADIAAWQRLGPELERSGFARIATQVQVLSTELTLRREQRRWQPDAAVPQLLFLLMLLRLLDDLQG